MMRWGEVVVRREVCVLMMAPVESRIIAYPFLSVCLGSFSCIIAFVVFIFSERIESLCWRRV